MYDNDPNLNQYPPPPQVPPAYGGPPAEPGWYPMQRDWIPPHPPGPVTTHYQTAGQPAPVYQPAPARGVSKDRKQTNHTFHLLMTLITCGMWAMFVWLPLTIWHALGPRRKNITRYR